MPKQRIPSYRYHKARDCAVVRLNGKDFYLGEWQSKASKDEYDRLIKQWLANGRAVAEPTPPDHKQIISVCEVVECFWVHAEQRYQKAGSWRVVLRTLIDMYGDQPAAEFGPVKLRAVMQALVERGNCRQYVNKNMHRVRKIFKWAGAHELVDGSTGPLANLDKVEALQKGTTDAPEGRKMLTGWPQ
jgi:hypothetical protein